MPVNICRNARQVSVGGIQIWFPKEAKQQNMVDDVH